MRIYIYIFYLTVSFTLGINTNNNNKKVLIAHLEFSVRLQLHMIKKNKNLTKRCNY